MAAASAAKKGGMARRAAERMMPSAALAGAWMEASATESGRAMSQLVIPATREAVCAHVVGITVRMTPRDAFRIARLGLPATPRNSSWLMMVGSAAMSVATPAWMGMAGGAPGMPAHGIHLLATKPTA